MLRGATSLFFIYFAFVDIDIYLKAGFLTQVASSIVTHVWGPDTIVSHVVLPIDYAMLSYICVGVVTESFLLALVATVITLAELTCTESDHSRKIIFGAAACYIGLLDMWCIVPLIPAVVAGMWSDDLAHNWSHRRRFTWHGSTFAFVYMGIDAIGKTAKANNNDLFIDAG